jgi:ribosome biogenesis SPOUT family RNA methylase Rps3
MSIYIIEHLDAKLGRWSEIEYENISRVVGKKNLLFTNVKDKKDLRKLIKFGAVSPLRSFLLPFVKNKESKKKICILDPEAKQLLSPKEAEQQDFFIFGGILGDYPPRKRTETELTSKFNLKNKNVIVRNIGKEQMSTDNAVLCVKKIAEGREFNKLKFKDNLELKFGKFLTMELPYRYNLVNGKPFISRKLLSYLKKKKGF